MDRLTSVLSQVNLITSKNSLILDATGGRFNMFKLCGVNHYENTHSAIIAEFLSPLGTHGLKHKLLHCFIESLGERYTLGHFNFERSRIKTEHSTDQGRIDILIEDNQNKAIIIENKIYAKDQYEQLKRYDKYAKRYQGGYQLVYLTLSGNEASTQSSDGVSYTSISYSDDIIRWLEKCVTIASRFPIVRETIIQYINHLKNLTNQDMDVKNKEEITELLSHIENLRAAQTIHQNYNAVFDFLAKKHFNPKMEDFAKKIGLEYHYQESRESYIQFRMKNPKWQGKCEIGFTFEGGQCHYGLCNNPKLNNLSKDNRILLHVKLNDLEVSSRKESHWWPFYSFYPNLSLDIWENDIIKSDTFCNECIERIEKLLFAMEGINL
jgi:hypothetical protein